MDVHSKYDSGKQGDITARFNERFLLSMNGVDQVIVVDDEMNVLPVFGDK